MNLKRLRELRSGLMAAMLDPKMPVAAIEAPIRAAWQEGYKAALEAAATAIGQLNGSFNREQRGALIALVYSLPVPGDN